MDEMHDRSVSGAEAVDEGRREFLQGVRRWSTAVATLALGGGFVAASAPSAAAWVNGSWINGPGGWVNRPGGWINGSGGGTAWVNRRGGTSWVNR